ncbi:MAG: GTP 3',8-cyclase MoaA [Candidatus Omnitrophica bacterium]|nr:GTP 3',8-cyclase MoaA [Candidatus Omnitrophota bacterium]
MSNYNYLRISVTDRCNLRCTYCMPCCGLDLFSDEELLSFEQVLRLGKIFAGLGVSSVRFTGGEPLLREDIGELIKAFKNIQGIDQVHLTTNAVLLEQKARVLKIAGLDGVNVSLDTLNAQKFKKFTGSDNLIKVISGIDKAKAEGFNNIKVNSVIMAGQNDDEVCDLVNFFNGRGLIGRFIEFMHITPLWDERLFIPIEDIKKLCEAKYGLFPSEFRSLGPAKYFTLGNGQQIGFIHTHSENCVDCSRLRISPTGKFKICLYEENALALKPLLQEMNDEELALRIQERICVKNSVDYKCFPSGQIFMSQIGG